MSCLIPAGTFYVTSASRSRSVCHGDASIVNEIKKKRISPATAPRVMSRRGGSVCAAAASSLRLTFELEGAGPDARVVGGHPALGAWSVEGGSRNGEVVCVPDGAATVIEYKWHDGSTWEEGVNRKLRLPGAESDAADTTLTLTVVDRAAHFPASADVHRSERREQQERRLEENVHHPPPPPRPSPQLSPQPPPPPPLPSPSSLSPTQEGRRVDGVPPQWFLDGVMYSIQTLGFCDCEGPPSQFTEGERLSRLIDDGWLEHVARLGCTVLYLGPLMKTSQDLGHGYDTADYFEVDPRLGTVATLRRVVDAAHALRIRVIVDGVFNHTGRDHFAARDVLQNGSSSKYW